VAGARQILGALIGLGDRCGYAILISLIPTLLLKEPYRERFETRIDRTQLRNLTRTSRLLDDILNRVPLKSAAYVGASAFAHKAGLHAHGVMKDPATYEHVRPELVGNQRVVPMSNQAGRSSLSKRLADAGLDIEKSDPRIDAILGEIKEREDKGYAYDSAQASFELVARRILDQLPRYFRVQKYRVNIDCRRDRFGQMKTVSEAVVVVMIGDSVVMNVSESQDESGNDRGPVNALALALAKDLGPFQSAIDDMKLVDFKVRITDGGTEAVTRVIIDSEDGKGRRWSTVGVSPNIVDASFEALLDAINWKLIRDAVKPFAE
ncbi:MAG: citramalate synthase, partial [Rhodobacteraceae bacterium]|nr:citramalate synthase [Paracoccaceae bacterium]